MDASENRSETWLPLAEAAPRMGLTIDGLRSRIRRGLVRPRKGNDGRLLVAVSTTDQVAGHEPGHEPVQDIVNDRSEAEELREEVLELRVNVARLEERLAAATRREADLVAAVRAKQEADAGHIRALEEHIRWLKLSFWRRWLDRG